MLRVGQRHARHVGDARLDRLHDWVAFAHGHVAPARGGGPNGRHGVACAQARTRHQVRCAGQARGQRDGVASTAAVQRPHDAAANTAQWQRPRPPARDNASSCMRPTRRRLKCGRATWTIARQGPLEVVTAFAQHRLDLARVQKVLDCDDPRPGRRPRVDIDRVRRRNQLDQAFKRRADAPGPQQRRHVLAAVADALPRRHLLARVARPRAAHAHEVRVGLALTRRGPSTAHSLLVLAHERLRGLPLRELPLRGLPLCTTRVLSHLGQRSKPGLLLILNLDSNVTRRCVDSALSSRVSCRCSRCGRTDPAHSLELSLRQLKKVPRCEHRRFGSRDGGLQSHGEEQKDRGTKHDDDEEQWHATGDSHRAAASVRRRRRMRCSPQGVAGVRVRLSWMRWDGMLGPRIPSLGYRYCIL